MQRSVIIILAFAALPSFAQESMPFNVRQGVGQFTLGTNKSFYGSTIRFLDSFTWKGIKEYNYIHTFDKPYTIEGVRFFELLLTFNESGRLKQISLDKIYTKLLFDNFELQATNDYKALFDFLRSNWGTRGKRKKKFNSLIAPGHEWIDQKMMMWSYLQKNENLSKNGVGSYGISIILILKDQE